MPCGMSPSATHFPKRNRLISGLSQGVVVIEAAKASGTLITARCALEQSKDVFVVPGSPLDPRYHGSNDLLKNGAILTTDFNDILDAFNWKHPKSVYTQESTLPTLSLEEPTRTFLPFNHGPEKTADLKEHLLSSLSSIPVGLDELMMKHQAPLKELSNSLFFLELEGKIKKLPGGKYVCL
jgi:DNA processing protein